MSDDGYNGWTNWDTWNTFNWLTHDENYYDLALKSASQLGNPIGVIRHALTRLLEDMGNPDEINYTNVNWREVIDALKEE